MRTDSVDPCGNDVRFSLILDASERLVRAGSMDEIVAVLRDTARVAVGAEGITVAIGHEGFCSYVAEDSVSPLWQGQTFPAEQCISGWVMRCGETVAISDVRRDPRIPQEAYAATFVRSLVMAPIGRPEAVAALGAYWSEARTHDADTIKRLECLARLATIAIENVRLAQARNFAAARGAAQNRILECAVDVTPLKVALDAMILEVEALSPSGFLGSILLLNEAGDYLQHCAGPSLPQAYNDAIEGISIFPNRGSGDAEPSRDEQLFDSNVASGAFLSELREPALAHGLQACWSTLIRSAEGRVIGAFVMYHREQRVALFMDIEIVDFVVQTVGLIVQRARAEAAIRISEARYRQIVEGAEDFAIITFDAQGMVTSWSAGAQRVVGYGADEVVGRKGDFFYTDVDQRNRVFRRERELARTEGRAVNERWHLRKDGTRFWGSGLMMPLALDHGGFLKIFYDRTAEHQAATALEESTARLHFFNTLDGRLFNVRQAEDAMLVATELLGQQLNVSRCAYADVESDQDRFCIRGDYHVPHVQSSSGTYSLDHFGPRVASDMRAGRTLIIRDVAAELRGADGLETFSAIGVEAIICCPLVKDGRLTAMMAVHQDQPRDWSPSEIALVKDVVDRCWTHIERVSVEMRLRDSEERLRLAVDNADIGFWDVDIIQDTLIWPPRTKAFFGISANVPVTMQDFYDGLHPEDREATTAAFAAATDPQRRTLYDVDYRTIGKEDGIVRWLAAKGRGVFNTAGQCVRVTGTVLEITARKIAEEELHKLNATLEGRIAEAIAEREEVQAALRQSQKMEAMGQLTGGVAHDFNNLLTPIVATLDLLQRKGVGGDREQRLISGAIQSADRAKTVVQRLLAFARRQPLQVVPVDVAMLVNDMSDLVASTIGPQIRIVVDAPMNLPAATADPNQLEMALLNLCVNARDAMPDGGMIRITVREESVYGIHRSKLPAGDYLCLSVADTGIGMDAATLARAVEPFFSTKGIGKGTGLGLSMAHGLASQLNGSLTIQSTPGVGTNVELWLPRSTAILPGSNFFCAEVKELRVTPMTVLLVDDEELVRTSTSDMLTDLGYQVIEATSGEAALKLLDAGQKFGLLVTDHLMPGISGTDLARLVRMSRPEINILLISGYAEQEGLNPDIPRLTKPFRKDELAAILSRFRSAF